PYLVGDAQKPMPVIGADPKMAILQDFPKMVAFYGYPGPFTTPVQEVVNLFVLPDMFTRVARGQNIEEVMKWGVGEYRRIFSKHKAAARLRRWPAARFPGPPLFPPPPAPRGAPGGAVRPPAGSASGICSWRRLRSM